MNESFTQVNRAAIARAIQEALAARIEGLSVIQGRADFANDYYNPASELVQTLKEFDTFYGEVVIQGHTFMVDPTLTPAKIEVAYTYLAGKGVTVQKQVANVQTQLSTPLGTLEP